MPHRPPRKGPRIRAKSPTGPFSRFVKERRIAMGLTQADLASLSGLSLDFIKDVERGVINLRLSKVSELVELLGGEINVQERIP